MTTVNAHFDGKVIVPDEPLDLPPNQPLIVRIEPVAEKREAVEGSVLSWLAANAVESDGRADETSIIPAPLNGTGS
jgi:hypothetical protein